MTVPPAQPGLIPDRDDLKAWWMDVDFIIDRQMQVMDQQHYYGQAVPFHFVNLSASAMPAVLGANMKFIDKETMWAYPCYTSVEQVAELAVDPQNIWYQKVIEITRRSVALAKGHHFVASYALNGITDILAGLYGTENFLVDLIAKPQEVARAMEHVKRIWIALFNEVEALIAQSENPGGIGWAGIWAPGTTFPLQEDFSYMISDTMFRQYCVPHLLDLIDAMEYPFYHLDGISALSHLDTLLAMDNLKVIQWVPGTGRECVNQWYGVISHILEAGKSVQVFAKVDEVDDLVKHVGARGLLISVSATEEQA
ncbi:MAG: hypothetical protein E4H27_07495, partial [Anaerolineales bacterium]